jgi:antitoxin component YwqK of YwqJK toxin-antitoxin module
MRLVLSVFLLVNCIISFAQEKQPQNGYVKFYYPNGNISSEGLMVNGKPDGFWKTYYVSGTVKSEGNRKNTLLDSIWLFYNELGDTTEKINYVLGKKNGYYYRYNNVEEKNDTRRNVILSKELYVNDKREGLSYYFYPNGSLYQTVNFKNNKKHGTAREYNKSGLIISILEYFNDYLVDKQNINRTVNGLKEGTWRTYFDNGRIESEKTYRNDNLQGYEKFYNKSGSLVLKQLYNDGKLVDKGNQDTLNIVERIIYDDNKRIVKKGYYREDVPVGIHREYDENGKVKNAFVYDEKGRIVSQGIINEDGSREGKWNYFFDDGEVKSEGLYQNNRQIGEWRFFFRGGKPEQIGNFSNGVLSGIWKWFYENGKDLRIENYVKGKRDGNFFEFSENGDTVTKGLYVEGEMNGFWSIDAGDVREEGNYVNDMKEGLWKTYYANGTLAYQGNYIQGNPDGKHIYYYDDGKIQEEQNYVNGIKEKNWYKFNEEGQLFLTITYQNDIETKINGFRIDKIKGKSRK